MEREVVLALVSNLKRVTDTVFKIDSGLRIRNSLVDNFFTVRVLERILELPRDSKLHVRVDLYGPWTFDANKNILRLTFNPVYFANYNGKKLILPTIYYKKRVKKVLLYLKSNFSNATFSGVEF